MKCLLTAMLFLSSCSGIASLEPAHKMAVENQANLSHNLQETLQHLFKAVRSHQDYDAAQDEPILSNMASTLTEQAAIATAYLVLIDAYIQGRKLTAETFRHLLEHIPQIVKDGADLWKELQAVLDKE